MLMPEPDRDVLANRATVVGELRRLLPGENVVTDEVGLARLRVRRPIGLSRPAVGRGAAPETTAEVSDILKLCAAHGVKVVPRGSGTGLSGGALPLEDGIRHGAGQVQPHLGDRLRQPRRRDPARRHQPRHLRMSVEAAGFYYAPDPVQPDRLFDRR